MEWTDPIDPPKEDCLDTEPAPRFVAPERFVEPQNEFRLIPMLREAAKRKDPYEILARAAAAFYRAQHPQPGSIPNDDLALGKALADLAVTGRVAYTRFQQTPTWLIGAVDGGLLASLAHADRLPADTLALLTSLSQATPTDFASAVNLALDRAFDVAWALRGPALQRTALRKPLRWIAVSGEDDKPHRPVNDQAVNDAPPPFEQFEIPVTVMVPGPPEHSLTVQTRFFIASAVEEAGPSGIVPSSRLLPPDPVPHVPAGHRVILFLHGHSSGAEEALPIIPHILKAGLDKGRKYSVISFDLPNNGYSETFDHERVALRGGTSWPSDPWDGRQIHTPILDYLEDFVVAFVDALDKITPIKNRFAGVIGGSLGGNLGLRLGQRDLTDSPWLKAGIVSWSAASVWGPMVNSYTNSMAPGRCWDRSIEYEDVNSSRRAYFSGVYDEPAIPVFTAGTRTQPEMWYRDGWEPCKTYHIQESRLARREVYDKNLRQWHWRLACEQLIFSHVDHVDHDKTKPFRYELNKVRQLLVAGEGDNFIGSYIYNCTVDLVKDGMAKVNTPGRSLFLKDTGHSMHLERPHYFAGEIVDFLPGVPTTESSHLDISYLVPLLLSEPALSTTDVSFLAPLLLSGPS